MPAYMRKLWQSGLCPFLVPAAFYETQRGTRIILKTEGLIFVRDYVSACPDGIEGSFCLLLEMLASAADGFAQLQRWLADPAFISLDPDSLFYDRSKERCLLLFRSETDDRPFSERFCDLCGGLGGSGDLISARLAEACSLRVTEEKGVSAFLRNWRGQILSGG